MTDPTIASATFSLGLYDCPSGRVEAECLGQDSALADKIQLRVRNEAQGVIAFLYLTPAQARGLRLALSQALEAHYREHPEQLGADIERDLTMELVPDLADPFNDAEEREANLRTARQFIQPDPADQLPELASRYLGGDRDPRRSPGDREAANRAMQRREAQEQTREQLGRVPPCIHGDVARLCPRCNQTPIEEVPF